MINPLFLGAIASLLFINFSKQGKTYKPLLTDLVSNHNMKLGGWKDNVKVDTNLNGFLIGDDDNHLKLYDNKPITLYLKGKEMSLETSDTTKAINKLMEITNSVSFEEKKEITKLIDLLLKYKTYYYFNKYLKYKNKYLQLKS